MEDVLKCKKDYFLDPYEFGNGYLSAHSKLNKKMRVTRSKKKRKRYRESVKPLLLFKKDDFYVISDGIYKHTTSSLNREPEVITRLYGVDDISSIYGTYPLDMANKKGIFYTELESKKKSREEEINNLLKYS